jgi:hypothetical protein
MADSAQSLDAACLVPSPAARHLTPMRRRARYEEAKRWPLLSPPQPPAHSLSSVSCCHHGRSRARPLLLRSSLSLVVAVTAFAMPCRARGPSAMATTQTLPLQSASAMAVGALLHGHHPFPLEAIPAQAKSSESFPILRSFVCAAFPGPLSSPLMSLAEQSSPSRGLTWSGHLEPPRAQPSRRLTNDDFLESL